MSHVNNSIRSSELKLDGEGPPYQQIERAILNKIQSGVWPPGYRLPTEEELSAQLGISRTPLVKVFKNLVNARVITRRRRHGTFVSERSDNHAVIGIIDIREIIESAGKTYSFEVLERRSMTARDFNVWVDVADGDRLLWLCLVHKANNLGEVFEERLINMSVIPEVESVSFESNLPNEWLLSRLPCTRLINTVRAALPERCAAQALNLTPGEPVLLSERRSFSNDDAVTWVRLSFPGYRHEFTGEFNPLLLLEKPG